MTSPRIENAPGLIWRPRKSGWEARWQARSDIIKKGFLPKTTQLWKGISPTDGEAIIIAQRCRDLQSEMLDWVGGRRGKRPSRLFREKGRIYFIGDKNAVKIGFSTNTSQRLQTLQIFHYTTLSIIAEFPGTPWEERIIHKRLKHLHIRGEWYRAADDLVALIKDLQSAGDLRRKMQAIRTHVSRNKTRHSEGEQTASGV